MPPTRKPNFLTPLAGIAAGTSLLACAALWSQAAPQKSSKSSGKPAAKPASTALSMPTGPLQYNRDIRPILAENCFACHGPDSAARKAGLRIDRPDDAYADRGGRRAISKGNPDESTIIRRIEGKGPLMPPRESHKVLTTQQIALLRRWVKEGAAYEAHWSYISPKRPALPAVKDTQWVRNPIDRFVLARLEKEGLKPAPEADRRTLIRRLSLDLTGLPPAPADVEAFARDKTPKAYENLVDRLLSSPQWGEHRGRYWLDYARYADTHGIHFDNYREVWAYRDWVIKAFNRNMPFDQFTIEQLAGDLLPNPTLDQRIATGFVRNNITTNEGGAIDEEYLVLYARDRTETTAQVWLGETAGCAVCHDHKFDPISQREFYSLTAFFNNTTQRAMDGNIKDTPPIIPVPKEEDRARFDALQAEIPAQKKQAEGRKSAARSDFENWLAKGNVREAVDTIPAGDAITNLYLPLDAPLNGKVTGTALAETVTVDVKGGAVSEPGHAHETAFKRQGGGTLEVPRAGDFEKDQAFTASAWVKLAPGSNGGALMARMDEGADFRGWDIWVEGNRVGTHIVSKWPDDALKVVAREPLIPGKWQHVTITYAGGGKPESVKIYVDGRQKDFDVASNTLKGSIRTTTPFKILQRSGGSGLEGTALNELRLYNTALSSEEANALASGTRAAYLASKESNKIAEAEKTELFDWWLPSHDAEFKTLSAKVTALEDEDRAIRMRGTVAAVASEKPEEPVAYVLYRGDYDKRRDKVTPITPAALPPMPANLPKNRLGLAKWLLLPNNPLTARVTVNRFWQEIFGQGLVRTSGDFGITGELPSHPELLDWMAVEFRDGMRWDVKRFFRMLVTSATYRQATGITPAKKARDPFNRLLSRGSRFRMDAEMVRDYALHASGLLSAKIGGPSVRPYQPDGVWEAVAMPDSNTRNYKRDTGESLYRRSMYTLWKRAAPPASMEIFNAPNRETCTVRRERTNTPLQALVTLNDEQYIEAARNLAQRALKEGGATPSSRVDFIARRLLSRPLRPEEQTVVYRSLKRLEAHYTANSKDAAMLIAVGDSKADATLPVDKLAAYTMLTNQLMNLDEVLNK